MAGSVFHDVNLAGTIFDDVNMQRVAIENASAGRRGSHTHAYGAAWPRGRRREVSAMASFAYHRLREAVNRARWLAGTRRLFGASLVAVLSAAAGGCDPCPDPAPVRGLVIRGPQREPVAGATLEMCNVGRSICTSTTTGADGRFELQSVVYAVNEGCAGGDVVMTCPDGAMSTREYETYLELTCP